MPTTFPSLTGVLFRTPLLCVLLALFAPVLRAQRTELPSPEEELRRFNDILEQAQEHEEEEEEDVDGRNEWFEFQRRFPYRTMPAGIRAQAVRETQALEQRIAQSNVEVKGGQILAAESRWANIGPFNVAGRIRAIAVHPTRKGTLFVGAASGGVWKTTGDFNNWTTTFDGQSALAIGSMVFDPTDPNIIYVGTGEIINSHTSQFNATPSYFGDGIFKSTDGGNTWTHAGLSQLGTISDIYIRPDNHQVIYVTSAQGGGGFYRSTNGGETWENKRNGTFFKMAVNPQNPDQILVASGATITRSTDGGNTWQDVQGFTPANGIRTSIALAPSNPSRVYALVALLNSTDGSNTGEVYRSDDGGATWTRVRVFGTSFFNAQGHYNNCIAVHPTNPDIVLAGGIDIFRTSNGGTDWSNTTRSYNGGNVHPDQHVLAFDPLEPNTVYLGDDGGAYRSTNSGSTWTRISLSLPISQFYELGLDQTRPYRAYGGTQDNGSWGAPGGTEWAQTWTNVSLFGGDGFHAIVDEGDPNFIYAESQYGRLYRVDVNAPQNFDYVTSQLDFQQSGDYDPGSWSTPIAMSPVDQVSLYSGRQRLWVTQDYGNSWIDLNVGNQSMISTIALSAITGDKLAVGTAGGEVYATTNAGQNWKKASGLPSRYISELIYDPVNPNRMYAVASGAGGGHVFRSEDNGATFTNITSTLPDVPTSAIAVDPQNNKVIFVGNDVGAFVSLDEGNLWLPFNNGLPYAPIVDMEIHKSRRMLVAATHGRSMFEVSIDNPQPRPILLQPNGGTPYQSGDTLKVSWAGFTQPVRVLISYDGGKTFDTIAVNMTGSSASYLLPLIRSTSTIVRVETLDGSVAVESDPFSINPKSNTDSQGTRGFIAGAIEANGRDLWVAQRGTDSIIVMRLPNLIPTGKRVGRVGMTGEVLDMAFDPASSHFFVLTGNVSDFSGARLFVMDTTGVSVGELPLPENAISGVTMMPQGLAVVTPGNSGRVYILDPASGDVRSRTEPLQNGTGARRTSLVWDGSNLGQGIDDAKPGKALPDALQRLDLGSLLTVREEIPVIVGGDETFDFFGLAFYPGNAGPDDDRYYITTTDGKFYRLNAPVSSSVRSYEIAGEHELTATINEVSPNPFRSKADIAVTLRQSGDVKLEVFDANGRRIATPFAGRLEMGDHRLTFDAPGVSSGIYYVVLTGPNGDRDIKPAVLLR